MVPARYGGHATLREFFEELRLRLDRDILTNRSVLMMLAMALLAPVQTYLTFSRFGIFFAQSLYKTTYIGNNNFLGLSAVLYLLPISTTVLFLIILNNVCYGISTDIEKGYIMVHLSLATNRKALIVAELLSTSIVPYTVFFGAISLSAYLMGFQGGLPTLLTVYFFDFLPVLLFFSAMSLVAFIRRERAHTFFSGLLYILAFSSVSYVLPLLGMDSVIAETGALLFGLFCPAYLAGIYYVFVMSYLLIALPVIPPHRITTISPASMYDKLPFTNPGLVTLIVVLNVVINIVLMVALFMRLERKLGTSL